jgi:hypothetical protein
MKPSSAVIRTRAELPRPMVVQFQQDQWLARGP